MILPTVFVLLINFWIDDNNTKKALKESDFNIISVTVPKIYTTAFVIFTLLGIVSLLVSIFSKQITFIVDMSYKESIVFVILSILAIIIGIFLTIASLNWKVVLWKDRNSFEFKSSFFKKYHINYSECQYFEYKEKIKTYIIYTKHCKIYVDEFCVHSYDFVYLLRKNGVRERSIK